MGGTSTGVMLCYVLRFRTSTSSKSPSELLVTPDAWSSRSAVSEGPREPGLNLSSLLRSRHDFQSLHVCPELHEPNATQRKAWAGICAAQVSGSSYLRVIWASVKEQLTVVPSWPQGPRQSSWTPPKSDAEASASEPCGEACLEDKGPKDPR